MKKEILAAGILTATLTGCVKEANFTDLTTGSNIPATESTNFVDAGPSDYVPDELLIKFRSGTPQIGIANALARIGGKVKEHVVTAAMKQAGDNEGFYLVRVPIGISVAIDKIKAFAEINYVEPNYIYSIPRTQEEPDANDPYYSSTEASGDNLWGMMGMLTSPYRNNYASRAAEAWSDLYPDDTFKDALGQGDADTDPDKGTKPQTGSDGVYVAVIDQGVDGAHPDLTPNVKTTYGYDFVSNDNNPTPIHASENHGTHVAGTIGALGNNSKGVAGLCWKVGIISVRFLNENGYGTAANAAKAIDHITNLKVNQGLNVVATNNSWGGLSSKTLQAAINRSEQNGILFIVAAGNSNSDNDRRASYPSCYTNTGIISVASITVDGTKSSFSSYGKNTVDLAAPGSYVWSTVPLISNPSGYAKMSGTSMATPHVTGTVALYAAAHNFAPKTKSDALAIKDAILKSTRPTLSFKDKCVSGGRLDVPRAIRKLGGDDSYLPAD